MESNHPVLSSLIKLHAEIGQRINENKRQIGKLVDDARHVEAVIRMLNPDFDIKSIAQKRAFKSNPFFKHGTAFRAVLEILRQDGESLTVGEMARRALASKGVSKWSSKEFRNLQSAIRSSIPSYERKGFIVRVGEGIPARWRLKD